MSRMRRTQIYLPTEINAALEHLAQDRRTSKADLLRLAVERLLEDEQPHSEDPILGLIGLGNAGPSRISEEHARVVNPCP